MTISKIELAKDGVLYNLLISSILALVTISTRPILIPRIVFLTDSPTKYASKPLFLLILSSNKSKYIAIIP